MSADNGIYIGAFPIENEPMVYEYRVIHAQAIDNLCYFADKELAEKFDDENPREIVRYFEDAKALSRAQAHGKAFDLEKEILNDEMCPILEYGISSMTFKQPFSFYKAHAHEIVYDHDKDVICQSCGQVYMKGICHVEEEE